MRTTAIGALMLSCSLLAACGGSESSGSGTTPDAGSGGAGTGGGAIGNGGAVGNGGGIGSGGFTGAGGAIGNGGFTGAGGVIGNGGFTGAGGAVSVAWQTTCANYAQMVCLKYEQCLPFLYDVAYSSQTVCAASLAAQCEDQIRLPGVTVTTSQFSACMTAFQAATCASWLAGYPEIQTCTSIAGSLPLGSGCVTDLQCASSACDGTETNGCKTCVAEAAENAPCDEATGPVCAGGFTCTNGFCVRNKVIGDPCTTAGSCGIFLNCVNSQCAPLQDLGDPCSTSLRCNGLYQGLRCNSTSGVCETYALPALGQPCTFFCAAGTRCNTIATPSTCVAARTLGQSCDTSGALPCTTGLECVNGICSELSALTCP